MPARFAVAVTVTAALVVAAPATASASRSRTAAAHGPAAMRSTGTVARSQQHSRIVARAARRMIR